VRIFTIGHSTRALDELVDLLRPHAIELLADVRTAPGSRRLPHFSRANLASTMPERGIEYRHLPELGGWRRPRPDSPNRGWRNESFRGFADYMATGEFRGALEGLEDLAATRRVAIMCSEAVPWRCHRSLIADALTVRGVAVVHVIGEGRSSPHTLTSFARVERDVLTYPGLDTLPLNA
jgi:uncharacterized protein (DUF488 family)